MGSKVRILIAPDGLSSVHSAFFVNKAGILGPVTCCPICSRTSDGRRRYSIPMSSDTLLIFTLY